MRVSFRVGTSGPYQATGLQGEKKMYIERKFAEAMFMITGLMACLVITVLLTAPV